MKAMRWGNAGACIAVAVAICAAVPVAWAQTRVAPRRGTVVQKLAGVEALRMLYQKNNFKDAERYAHSLLWKDVRQPEVLYLLGQSQERLRKPQEAAAAYTLYLRVVAPDSTDASAKFRPMVEKRLKALKQDPESLRAAYAKAAAAKKFTSPEEVNDAWMDNVEADLFSLHGLYAWKLAGGRKDAKPDWIHNTHGRLHRSGMKYVEELEGRKGVLFGVPLKDFNSADADQSNREALQVLGHNSRITARNVVGGKILRVGARGYGFPFELRVLVDDKEIAKEVVRTEEWSDLKIDLPEGGKKDQEVMVELIVPEGQQWSEGVWIDYLDFFDN